jgi:hypothetical protein
VNETQIFLLIVKVGITVLEKFDPQNVMAVATLVWTRLFLS